MINFITKHLTEILDYCDISKIYYDSLPSKKQSEILSYIYSKTLSNQDINAYVIKNMII
mgnify:CR=1 FL=1